MSKGNRKRSNVSKPKDKKVVEKKEVKNKPKTIYEEFPVPTLNQSNANEIQEIFNVSNSLAALIKDYADKSIQVNKMRNMAKKIEKEKKENK